MKKSVLIAVMIWAFSLSFSEWTVGTFPYYVNGTSENVIIKWDTSSNADPGYVLQKSETSSRYFWQKIDTRF
jgi:hypothetical protein